MKRFLSLFIAVVMIFSLVPAYVFTSSAAVTLYWPLPVNVVAIGRITSAFGPRVAPTTGASTNHRGIDTPAPLGTAVYSVYDGVVTAVGSTSARGNYVVIYHAAIGMSSLYQHLKSSSVQVGDTVIGGKQVAVSGNTGVGTGAHLHYGLMVGKATNPNHDQPAYNMAIDPLSSDITYVASAGGANVPNITPDNYTYPTRDLYYTSPVMTGDDVKWVQSALYQLGYTIDIDGSFGPATKSVVTQFQTDHGLTANGTVNSVTRETLLALWNYKKGGNYNIELHSWVSSTQYGEASTDFFLKETYYLNFELIDSTTGLRINSLVSKSYTVVMAFFNPDGSVHSTVTLASTDTGTLAAVPYDMGTYLAAVAVVGDITLNTEFYFTARYNPTMTASVNSVSLNLAGQSSQTFTLTLSGSYPDLRGVLFSSDTSVATATLGTVWNGSSIDVTVTGVGVGSTDLVISLLEGHTGGNSVVGTLTIPVNVTTTSYSVSYNANGGSGAPASQTKYHNTNLTLSSTVPTRAGYEFLGWSASASATTATYAAGGTYTANSGVTLYAVWKESVVLSSIQVYQNPTKTTYYIGDSFNTAGLIIRLNYSDGSTANISTGYTISGFSSGSAGTKTVTVAYGGKTTTFNATVKVPTITLSHTEKTVSVGDALNITATTDPVSAVTWESDDPNVVDFVNGVLTAKGEGNAVIVVSFEYNGVIYIAECDVAVQCSHKNVTVHSAKNATEYEDGYTGDTYCDDCGEMIAEGEVIPALVVRGDADGDGDVDAADLASISRILSGGEVEVFTGADYNGDGDITVTDLAAIRRVIAGGSL